MSADQRSDRLRPDDQSAPPGVWRRRLQLALAMVIIAPAVWFAVRYMQSEGAALPRLGMGDAPAMALLLGSLALVMVTNGLILRDLTAQFGARLNMRTWLGITLVASMLNLVSPIKGGAAVRAAYLKRLHGVTYSAFASVLGSSLVCSIAVSAALAAVALVALGVPGGRYGWIALASSVALFIVLVALLRFVPRAPNPTNALAGRLAQIAQGWRTVSSDRRLVTGVICWSVAGALLHALAFVLAFRLAGFNGSWLVPVASSAFARIGALIAITPAGLGIFEAFGAVSAQIVGAEPGPAVLAVLIVRVVATAVTVVGGAFFSLLLVRGGMNGAPERGETLETKEH